MYDLIRVILEKKGSISVWILYLNKHVQRCAWDNKRRNSVLLCFHPQFSHDFQLSDSNCSLHKSS